MRHSLAVVCFVVALHGVVCGQPAAQGEALYGVAVATGVKVEMEDGTRQALEIYFPAGTDGRPVSGRFPAVLERSPYGSGRGAQPGPYFARRGYVFVLGHTRGAHDSEGRYYLHVPDGKDGAAVVEWIARQPWSNGKVATYGGSYSGTSGLATGLQKPPHLSAQFIREASTDYHDGGGAYSQGVWMHDKNLGYTLDRVLEINWVTRRPDIQRRMREAREPANYAAWLGLPASRHLELFRDVPEAAAWYRDWLAHPSDAPGDPYWKQYGLHPSRFGEYPAVPVYFLGAWYDLVQRPFMKTYAGLSAANAAPKRLIIGPWVHGPESTVRTSHGEVEFGAEAAVPILALAERWFRQWLKGEDTGILREPPVRLFVMGTGDGRRTQDGKLFHGGYWRDEQEYPLARAQATRLYLHAGGGLRRDPPAGNAPPSRYAFDPRDPVPTIFTRQGGGYDQRCRPEYSGCRDGLPLAARPDVLVFRSEPLEAPLEVTGPISVTLYVSSDAPDTDFSAKLVDEYPPSRDFPRGFDLILVDAMRRARYRDSLAEPRPLEPGRVHAVTIELPPTGNVFKKGHRIRVDVSSSNFPKFGVNPNTGEPIEFHTTMRIARNAIHHDAEHRSFIELPIVPSPGATAPTAAGAESR